MCSAGTWMTPAGNALCVASATEAIQFVQGGVRPDLLIIDIRLPDIYGPVLALRLHALELHAPVLFISGWMDGIAVAEKLTALRWSFLQKPFGGPH